jgi:hypothetical protein
MFTPGAESGSTSRETHVPDALVGIGPWYDICVEVTVGVILATMEVVINAAVRNVISTFQRRNLSRNLLMRIAALQ